MLSTPYRLSQHLDTYASGYRQALSDFYINSLITRLQSLAKESSPETIEKLAILLIQDLNHNVNESLVNLYLAVVNSPQTDMLPFPIDNEYLSMQIPPLNFSPPCFQIGNFLRYIPDDDTRPWDFGRVIGYYYCYATHQCVWMWRYVLWLEAGSPSADWLKATVAWEDDLEVYHGS